MSQGDDLETIRLCFAYVAIFYLPMSSYGFVIAPTWISVIVVHSPTFYK